MVTCAVKLCRNYSSKKVPGVTFFKFPKDPVLKRKWMAVVRREDWLPTKNSCVCSIHFEESTYALNFAGTKRLLCGAVPTKNFYFQKKKCEIDKKISKELEDSSDDDLDTSDDDTSNIPDTGVQTCTKIYTYRNKNTDTESGVNSPKITRLNFDDIKIDYVNVDIFGKQIAFLLKRLPRNLWRELQESIVTLVKTATTQYESKTQIDTIPSTSSSTKVVDILSKIVFTPTLVTKPHVNEEITIKEEPEGKSVIEENTFKETKRATQDIDRQIETSINIFPSRIKPFPKPMTVPMELIGSMDCVKQEILDPGESSDHKVLTLSNPLETEVKIEIGETDLIEQTNRRLNSWST